MGRKPKIRTRNFKLSARGSKTPEKSNSPYYSTTESWEVTYDWTACAFSSDDSSTILSWCDVGRPTMLPPYYVSRLPATITVCVVPTKQSQERWRYEKWPHFANFATLCQILQYYPWFIRHRSSFDIVSVDSVCYEIYSIKTTSPYLIDANEPMWGKSPEESSNEATSRFFKSSALYGRRKMFQNGALAGIPKNVKAQNRTECHIAKHSAWNEGEKATWQDYKDNGWLTDVQVRVARVCSRKPEGS